MTIKVSELIEKEENIKTENILLFRNSKIKIKNILNRQNTYLNYNKLNEIIHIPSKKYLYLRKRQYKQYNIYQKKKKFNFIENIIIILDNLAFNFIVN